MQIISYGGGIQTVALAILNATGQVTPRAEVAVFADPGAEMPGTYRHIEIMQPWLAERGMELVTVRQDRFPPLEQNIRERSTTIPVRWNNGKEGGIGRRACTTQWKIEPINKWLKAQGVTHAITQIGFSLDEFHRMRPSPIKWIENRYPLIDMGLSRDDCRRIIEEVKLPQPPKSACYFCPLNNVTGWQLLAVYHPDLFDKACELERAVNRRGDYNDGKPVYLSSRLRPLVKAFSKHQLPLPGMPEPDDMCGGYCFV